MRKARLPRWHPSWWDPKRAVPLNPSVQQAMAWLEALHQALLEKLEETKHARAVLVQVTGELAAANTRLDAAKELLQMAELALAHCEEGA